MNALVASAMIFGLPAMHMWWVASDQGIHPIAMYGTIQVLFHVAISHGRAVRGDGNLLVPHDQCLRWQSQFVSPRRKASASTRSDRKVIGFAGADQPGQEIAPAIVSRETERALYAVVMIALLAMIRRSQASANERPAPAAAPGRAVMVGFGILNSLPAVAR
jgi:hypothetical protein